MLKYLLLLAVILVVSACSNTKYLQKDQSLYISSKVDVNGDILNSEKQDLRSSLSSKSLMTQQPNKKLLNTRIKVWLYNQKYNEKKSNWFWNLMLSKRNLEEPVIYDSTKTKESITRMTSYLHNQGFFYASVAATPNEKHSKTSVTYSVTTGRNFILDKITFSVPDSDILAIVQANQRLSLIKKGVAFKSATLSSERERLTRIIKDAGYYKFNRDAIEFTVDTLNKSLFRNSLNPFEGFVNIFNENKGREKPTMDVEVKISNPEDSTTWQRYHINKIYAYPDFPLNASPNDSTLREDNRKYITIRSHQEILKPKILSKSILLRPGETYSLQQYNNTVNKLYDLGVWQFVTLQYKENKDTAQALDAYLFLTPRRRQEMGVNFEVSNSTDYTLGSGVSLNYRHINLNKSATQLGMSLNTGIELVRQQNNGWVLQSREFGGQVSLTWPRFALPFNIRQAARSNVKTRLSLGANFLSRVEKFDITSINASYGYDWNETAYKRWIVRPFTLNYVGVTLNDYFKETTVDPNPYLKRSFEPALIGGENVSFIYSNNDLLHQRHYSYFRINAEESGLWLNGINSLVSGVSGKKTDVETLTKVSISNFVKLEADYRHYWRLGVHSSLATRIYAGVGIPYSYSQVLPYVRQFTAGGPNSIRAWRLRTLGPGSYKDTSANAQIFPDQTGDMKLEGNIEYRFDLLRMFGGTINLKGATFIDMGNIWMIKKDSTRPGSDFRFSQLYSDLAMGTGAGLRLDFSFFLIRLDWGIPLKVPYYTGTKNGWYISKWDLKDSEWRKNNIIWNIAIGYPF